MADMLVRSYVSLSVPAEERHLKTAREAAEGLTTDKSAICVEVSSEDPKLIITTFPMKRARQMDVSDRVMDAFSQEMEDYSDQGVGFPKTEAEEHRDRRKLERAKERRRARRAEREAEGCRGGSLAIPRELFMASQQIEQLLQPLKFSEVQRVQFFVLLQVAMFGRMFADLGHVTLSQQETDRIYELSHEFVLPKDLFANDDGFFRGRVYELVRIAELLLSTTGLPIDVIPAKECKATDAVMAWQNFHAMIRDSLDGSELEGVYRRK